MAAIPMMCEIWLYYWSTKPLCALYEKEKKEGRLFWSSALWQGASLQPKSDSLGLCMLQWFNQTE